MEKDNSYEIMVDFVKTRADKYKALEEKNKIIDKSFNRSSVSYCIERAGAVSDFYRLSALAFDKEYQLTNFLDNLDFTGLGYFNDMVNAYGKKREEEIKALSLHLFPESSYETVNQKVEYYEKYEAPSIDDLLFIVARRRYELFGLKYDLDNDCTIVEKASEIKKKNRG